MLTSAFAALQFITRQTATMCSANSIDTLGIRRTYGLTTWTFVNICHVITNKSCQMNLKDIFTLYYSKIKTVSRYYENFQALENNPVISLWALSLERKWGTTRGGEKIFDLRRIRILGGSADYSTIILRVIIFFALGLLHLCFSLQSLTSSFVLLPPPPPSPLHCSEKKQIRLTCAIH